MDVNIQSLDKLMATNQTISRALIINEIGKVLSRETVLQIADVQWQLDCVTFDWLITLTRKSDRGRCNFRLERDMIKPWGPEPGLGLTEEMSAMLILFLA